MQYDKNGNEFLPQGIYLSEKECIKREKIESFEQNIAPEQMTKMIDDDDYVPVNYHLKQTDNRLKNPNASNQTSFAVSDVSDMTTKEARID